MKILVTGARGFVGRNLVAQLHNMASGAVPSVPAELLPLQLLEYDVDDSLEELAFYCKNADFVFHLAGVNRPKTAKEFITGNFCFTSILLNYLEDAGNRCPVMMASSTQALLDNSYGKSKRAGEVLMRAYGEETGAKVLVYRFPNLFGKWCRPNYNSVVATFCHHIAHGEPISVNDPDAKLTLAYIDDVVAELIGALQGKEHREAEFCVIPTVHQVTVGDLAILVQSFRQGRQTLTVPNMGDDFTKKLYATYLSYLPTDGFRYELTTHRDDRGSFTELFKSLHSGQVSVNISKPHITKGEHWHHTKNEKFVVVQGHGVIRFRDMREAKSPILSYEVSGEQMEVVDIPTGYTHNIENLGDEDMVTVMWCNECFDPAHPDTYYEPVTPPLR